MSVALITVTTKPADTSWFNVAQPDLAKSYATWVRRQPGFIAMSTQRITQNISQNVVIFDTKENLDAFVATRAENPDYKAREEYKTRHNQTTVVTIV